MAKNKSKPEADEKPQGFVDRLLHGDHGHATEAEEKEVEGEESEGSDPKESEPKESEPVKEKVSADAGAASDMSAHPKFAKFKKGN
jgi:hypothetical protein